MPNQQLSLEFICESKAQTSPMQPHLTPCLLPALEAGLRSRAAAQKPGSCVPFLMLVGPR